MTLRVSGAKRSSTRKQQKCFSSLRLIINYLRVRKSLSLSLTGKGPRRRPPSRFTDEETKLGKSSNLFSEAGLEQTTPTEVHVFFPVPGHLNSPVSTFRYYMHTYYIHTYTHTYYIHTYIATYIHATCMHACMHATYILRHHLCGPSEVGN